MKTQGGKMENKKKSSVKDRLNAKRAKKIGKQQREYIPYDWALIYQANGRNRGVAIFAKACFGHPNPSKRQKLNATANAFGAPDVLRTCHFATTIVNSVLAS
jgi:hypothetical protein